MTLEELRTFVAIVEQGNIARAAGSLNTPSATVSKRLRDLETDLGVTLVERNTHSCKVTDWGLTLLPQARATIEAAAQCHHVITSMKSDPGGIVRVTAPSAFGRTFLTPLLPLFREAYPQIVLSINFDNQLVRFENGGTDVAVHVGPAPDSDLVRIALGAAPLRLVCSPSYAAARGLPAEPAQLSGHDIVEIGHGSFAESWRFRRGAVEVAIDHSSSISVYDPSAARDMVIAGAGIAILSELFCKADLEDSKLVEVLADWTPLPDQSYALLLPKASRSIPAVKTFVDFARTRLRKQLAPFTSRCVIREAC
jgi:DNA-binding transcriptional LysR family regulator